MAQVLSLESFEAVAAGDHSQSPDYSQGFEDGHAAGLAAARAADAALTEQFVQSILDIDVTYAEAQGQILRSLAPLFDTIVARVLPLCVDLGFADQLAAILREAAECNMGAPLSIEVHPDRHDAVAQAMAGLSTQVHLQTDPALGPHAARIGKAPAESLLDIDAMLAGIRDIFGAIHSPDDRSESHG